MPFRNRVVKWLVALFSVIWWTIFDNFARFVFFARFFFAVGRIVAATVVVVAASAAAAAVAGGAAFCLILISSAGKWVIIVVDAAGGEAAAAAAGAGAASQRWPLNCQCLSATPRVPPLRPPAVSVCVFAHLKCCTFVASLSNFTCVRFAYVAKWSCFCWLQRVAAAADDAAAAALSAHE